MTIQSLDQSILSTLAYAAVFSAGVHRIHFRSWLHTSEKISNRVLFTRLQELVTLRLIEERNGVYVFDSKIKTNGSAQNKITYNKWATMWLKLKFFTWVPWITAIGITGSVAAFNAREDDDLDLIIITKRNRLWISRLCVSIPLLCLGYLRTHESHKVSNKLCLNVWLDESSLCFTQQNLYIARELAQICWIYDMNSIQEKIEIENRWFRTYFANKEEIRTTSQSKSDESPHIYRMITALNTIAFGLQVWYMGRHRSRETVERSRALFHPKDVNGSVLVKYKKIFAQYKKSYNGRVKGKG